MVRILAVLSAVAFSAQVDAQEAHQHDAAEGHGHHAHEADAALGQAPEIAAAIADGGQLVTLEVLGMVCDFCATALNRTFTRREEVAAIYVDLDARTLNVVLLEGAELADAEFEDLVERAGYRVASLTRGTADAASPSGAASDEPAGSGERDASDDT